MLIYLLEHFSLFFDSFCEHLMIVFESLMISLILSFVISYILLKSRKLTNIVIHIFSMIYSIPSLALFAILIPITGLGNTSALIVLVLYNQYLLVRNIMSGLENVDEMYIEAAKGLGLSQWQILYKIQFPLALPSILAGIRLAIISTTGIATIASSINAGGLGNVLFSGLRTNNSAKLLWGTILCVLIAFMADFILKKCEKKIHQLYERT